MLFGYVRVHSDELKVKEFNLYKRHYCELCRNMGSFSQWTRLFHSYDPVFYFMLCSNESACAEDCRKRHLRCASCKGSEQSRHFAALSISLIFHKFNNDVLDGERKKRFPRLLVKSGYRKTLKQYPCIGSCIAKGLDELLEYERQSCSDYEFLADLFGATISKAVSGILGHSQEDVCRLDIIKEVSACVYLIDVLDDSVKDSRTNEFNPLNLLGGGQASHVHAQQMNELIMSKLSRANSLLELLPYSENIPILRNIVCLGMPMRLKDVYEKHIREREQNG